jgi:hypothetical protein
MNKLGRKPNIEPKTAYDVRRYITLVQVLALQGSDESIRDLCEAWDVEIVEDRSIPPYKRRYYMNQWATIRALARHVIEYHKDASA